MKRMSDKARKRYLECKPIRDELRESVGRCEICDRHQSFYPLDVHEISRGVHRQKSLDKLFALLVVCRPCHELLGSAKEWPEARQLAVLAEKRLHDWDLTAYLELTNPKAPKRIELHEVVKFMSDQVLKVEEVATKLRVNRRTAQSWIDSKELPAIDVRPVGAERALWRVEPGDLLKFAADRKYVGKNCTKKQQDDFNDQVKELGGLAKLSASDVEWLSKVVAYQVHGVDEAPERGRYLSPLRT